MKPVISFTAFLTLVSSGEGSLKHYTGLNAGIPLNVNEPCPQGWVPYNSYCYMASDSIKTRNEAQQFCVQRGAELVKITSQAENDFVLALAREKAPSVKQVWIGLRYQRSVRAFYWSDNSVLTYNNWAPHEPSGNGNEQCGHMWTGRTTRFPARASGYWNDISCATKKVFPNGLVCKKLAAY
ncbi:snaclec coagulation factor IX-binding protein subunit A-like [Acropora palmata]|uniref:snaclec coagulation factor IX-binding protein subunit A-like n=1 Tax=Acropora palmata TaxID=6131 RepID=UPI003DA07AAA